MCCSLVLGAWGRGHTAAKGRVKEVKGTAMLLTANDIDDGSIERRVGAAPTKTSHFFRTNAKKKRGVLRYPP